MGQVEAVHDRSRGGINAPQVLKQADEGSVVLEGQPVGQELVDAMDGAQELSLGHEH